MKTTSRTTRSASIPVQTGRAPAGRPRTAARRRVARLLLAGTVAGASALALAAPAGATTPTFEGPATLFNNSTGRPDSGGSADLFTVNLPAGAACPGDTTTGGYLIDTYLVPQSTAVTSLTFSGGFPSSGYSLYNSTNNHAFNAANTNTGTGQIAGIPQTLQFLNQVNHSHPTIATLLAVSGVWEAGIACELSGALTYYWNTQVTFTGSQTDAGGFTWTDVPGAPTPPPSTPEVPYTLALPVLAAGIAGGSVLVRRRRGHGAHARTSVG
jgi:hypothetical protein